MPMATINYNVADHGDKYVISPVCYFDTKGNKVKVKLDKETGRLLVKPKIKPKADKLPSTVTQQIYGGFLYLPKKADLTKDPVIRHEGPQGQLLKIDIAKQVDA